jgi:putative acetyltransferase
MPPSFQRPMNPGEEAVVERLLQRAFKGSDEARLVRSLRKSRQIAGEMVVPGEAGIVGYYALSKMVEPKGWLALAPVAIDPDWQGRGIGRRMVGMAAEWARLSRTMIVVLGAVPFYRKAGFKAARAAKLVSGYPVDHLLLAGPGDDAPAKALVYPPSFDGI